VVKEYERLTIEAAVERCWDRATFALMTNPIVGNWDAARRFLDRLADTDPGSFAGFRKSDILPAALLDSATRD
jgi:alpha-galactosidase/6-phospho-beta-glucosidase family protein